MDYTKKVTDILKNNNNSLTGEEAGLMNKVWDYYDKKILFKLLNLYDNKDTIHGYKFRGGHAHCSRHEKYFDIVYNFIIN